LFVLAVLLVASLLCFWSSFVPVLVVLFCACGGCGSGRLWLCLWWCSLVICSAGAGGGAGGLCFCCWWSLFLVVLVAFIGAYKHKKKL